MKFKILNDILLIDVLSIILILSIIFIPSTVVRVILGLPFVLFFPGYTLVAALFVKHGRMNNIERLSLSIGLSLAIAAMIGFGLNYTTWGIKLNPIIYIIVVFIFIMSAIVLVRRARTLKISKLITEFELRLPGWGGNSLNKSLSVILIIVAFGTLGTLAYTTIEPKVGEKFAEFYILGINGNAEDYPNEFVMNNGQISQVIYGDGTTGNLVSTSGYGTINLWIINQEQQTVFYTVKMTIDGAPTTIYYGGTNTRVNWPIELNQGEKWETSIDVIPQHTGDEQKVELLLFKGDGTLAEDSVYFWINVQQAQ